ncbi:post-PEP-CTERM-1 domain-containing protein [Rhodanobacter sp. Col0626]|uniref:post-PEP-CTERM-1 domain-containing protein n=1 Tax=Rhodanobacter sp. Col0626 TaxID=3415679 RepID=UPI003CECAD6D
MHKKVVLMAIAMTGLFASVAMASEKPVQPAQPVEASSGSMQIAVFDPITKKLRAPTAEEAAAFAKSVNLNRQNQALRPSTSGRPRNEAEALKTLRKVRIKGVEVELMDTPESEMSNVVGKRDANGHLVAMHPGDSVQHAAAVEVTQ